MNDMGIIRTLNEAVSLVPPGKSTISFGGNALHRVPHAFVRALALRDDVWLHIVKTAGAYDVDMLSLAGLTHAVSAGFVGYEGEFGLARHYRRGVESGDIEAREHACYSVIAALRAGSYGIPSIPIRAFEGSDIPEARGFLMFRDPYTGEELLSIPAIRPDIAVIHVQYADSQGNGVILGPKNEDCLLARAARQVILTAEKIVFPEELPVPPDHVDVPGILVNAVVETPGGAWPGSCFPLYDIDAEGVRNLQALNTPEELSSYLEAL